MRVFFALEPESETKIAIQNWRDTNLVALPSPVPPQNFHITLGFLGEIDHRQVDTLCSYTDEQEVLKTLKMQTIQIDQLGYWPKEQILWIGPRSWPNELDTLSRTLKNVCLRFGGKKDRREFQPHVTLSRNADFGLQALTEPNIEFRYERFSLYESIFGRDGVRYQEIASWELNRLNRFL